MKTLFIQMKLILIFFPVFFATFLAGCSSGGSSSNNAPPPSAVKITGTAAAGAPVVGYVSVRDSSTNPQPVKTNIPIEANGNYSVDVTGLKAPYAFLASGTVGGKTVSLYSAATSADEGKTINITPFTDLMIRNIAATAVDTYLAGGGMASLTTAQLDAQRIALTNQLAPALSAMGLSGSIDLLRATFNADHTGLDRFMDVVQVDTTTASAVTITNTLDAANKLIIDTTASTTTLVSSGNLSVTGLTTPGTPIDGILQTFTTFSGLFKSSLPNPTDPALTALFTANFMENGRGSSAFLTDITTSSNSIGLNFSNVVLDTIDAAGTTAQVHFTVLGVNGGKVDKVTGWLMKKNATTGVWQMDGNQRIARVSVRTLASKSSCNPANTTTCTMGTTYRTGLNLELDNNAAQSVGSAVVTGPGLPAGGVTLTQQVNQTWFSISTNNPDFPICNGCSMGTEWQMTDAKIAAVLPDSVYTVTLKDLAGAAIAGAVYTEKVPVAPALNTAVANLAYPSIGGMVNLAGIGATTLTPSWTIPTGLWGDYLYVNMWQTGTNANLNVEANNLTSSTGTATLVITAPLTSTWTSGSYGIGASDQYGGTRKAYYQ